MRRNTTVLVAVVAVALTLAGRLPGAAAAGTRLFEGTHEGADFLIGMPEKWNGGLVLFAHGYEGEVHETGDFRVPFRLQQDYRRRTLAAGTSHFLVQRAVRWAGHCAFDGVVRERAFEDLVGWIERGVVPKGDDVLDPDVSKLGLRWTPALHPADPLASRAR